MRVRTKELWVQKDEPLKGEVLWESRRRKIETDYSTAVPLAVNRMDLWTLRRLIVLAIDSGQRLDFKQLFLGSM